MKIGKIEGERIFLRKLRMSDKSGRYLKWLNDEEVQKYTRRRHKTSTMRSIESFLKSLEGSADYHFAIIVKDGNKHIGNISINSLNAVNKSAEVSIMIGEKNAWGKGYAKEAIMLICEVAFSDLGLHRLWAESPNPAFNALMEKLCWVREGIGREAFKFNNSYLDYECWSMLEDEWRKKRDK